MKRAADIAKRKGSLNVGPVQTGCQPVNVDLPGQAPRERPPIEHEAKGHAAFRREVDVGRHGAVRPRGGHGRKQPGQGNE